MFISLKQGGIKQKCKCVIHYVNCAFVNKGLSSVSGPRWEQSGEEKLLFVVTENCHSTEDKWSVRGFLSAAVVSCPHSTALIHSTWRGDSTEYWWMDTAERTRSWTNPSDYYVQNPWHLLFLLSLVKQAHGCCYHCVWDLDPGQYVSLTTCSH